MVWAAQMPGTVCRPETNPSAHLADKRVGSIYRRVVTSGTGIDVVRRVRQIAAGLQERLGELTAIIQRCLQEEIPALGQDAQSIELLGASVGGNVDTVLHAMRYGIDVQRVEAPTAAMEYARRLAQHEVPVRTGSVSGA
jgi:hypothetical protein